MWRHFSQIRYSWHFILRLQHLLRWLGWWLLIFIPSLNWCSWSTVNFDFSHFYLGNNDFFLLKPEETLIGIEVNQVILNCFRWVRNYLLVMWELFRELLRWLATKHLTGSTFSYTHIVNMDFFHILWAFMICHNIGIFPFFITRIHP